MADEQERERILGSALIAASGSGALTAVLDTSSDLGRRFAIECPDGEGFKQRSASRLSRSIAEIRSFLRRSNHPDAPATSRSMADTSPSSGQPARILMCGSRRFDADTNARPIHRCFDPVLGGLQTIDCRFAG